MLQQRGRLAGQVIREQRPDAPGKAERKRRKASCRLRIRLQPHRSRQQPPKPSATPAFLLFALDDAMAHQQFLRPRTGIEFHRQGDQGKERTRSEQNDPDPGQGSAVAASFLRRTAREQSAKRVARSARCRLAPPGGNNPRHPATHAPLHGRLFRQPLRSAQSILPGSAATSWNEDRNDRSAFREWTRLPRLEGPASSNRRATWAPVMPSRVPTWEYLATLLLICHCA